LNVRLLPSELSVIPVNNFHEKAFSNRENISCNGIMNRAENELSIPLTVFDPADRLARIWSCRKFYLRYFLRIWGRVSVSDLLRRHFPWIVSDGRVPPTIIVELTTHCQLACSYCPNPLNIRSKGVMSSNTVESLVGRVRESGVTEVCIVGGGEPTLHPRFAWVLARLSEAAPVIRLTSNGQHLPPATIEAILMHVDLLNISVDSYHRAGYESRRVHGDFEKLLRNLNSLRTTRKRLGSRTLINIRCMIRPADLPERAAIEEFWGRLADVVTPQYVQDYVPADDVFRRKRSPDTYPRCTLPHRVMIVNWTGEVPLCFNSGYQTGKPEGFVIGNIKEARIQEIWNSPVFKQYRLGHRRRRSELIPICRGCAGT